MIVYKCLQECLDCIQNAKQSYTYLEHATIELHVWMTINCLVTGGSQGHKIMQSKWQTKI